MTSPAPITMLVMPRCTGGGAERQVQRLRDRLVSEGHRVTIVVTESESVTRFGAAVDWFDPTPHVELRLLHSPIIDGRVAELAALVTAQRPSTIVIVNDRVGYRALPSIRSGQPEIRIVELVFGLEERPVTLLRSASLVDATLVESEGVARVLRSFGERVSVAPNGVDVGAFDPDRSRTEARRTLGLRSGRPVIGFLGRLDATKGPDVLLEAASTWRDLAVDVVFAGAGPMRSELARRRGELPRPIRRRVRFLGHTEATSTFLAACDVVVVPSRRDGRPNVVLEAMAAGRAIVASAVGDIPEMIEDGCTGRLVAAGNAAELAGAVRELVDDRARADLLGRAARAAVAQRWPLDRMLPAMASYVVG